MAVWTTPHQLNVQQQYRTWPGAQPPPLALHASDGIETSSNITCATFQATGLVIATCNCGFTTGWIPKAELAWDDLKAEHSPLARSGVGTV